MSKSQTCFNPDNCAAAIAQAEARYAKLLFVVGRSGTGKTALLRTMAKQFEMPLFNLGLELSRRLLPLDIRERKLGAADLIADMFDEINSSRIAVDNTEIIFDADLELNPVGLLEKLSRTRLLVWSWNGKLDDGHVIYGEPGHREYRRMPTDRITLITL
ncbi:MAG: BREX-3 system P-loop-containing protein BrxF [Pseudomonadota bacterium]